MGQPHAAQPVSPAPQEHDELLRLAKLLNERVVTLSVGREAINIPKSALRVLREAVDVLAQGDSTSVVRVERELTTQQAAELLNVSRQYVVRLIEAGEIPATETAGGHRRIQLNDLLAFKEQRDARRRSALDELEDLTESYGGYAPLKK